MTFKVIKIPHSIIYPKFEVEFFDVVKTCAEHIDRINCVTTRLARTDQLNFAFARRDKKLVMSLFKELTYAK